LSAEEQQTEIRRSRRALEEITGREVIDFAYPFGGPSDVSRVTVDAARASGFSTACTTASGPINADTDHLRVPRAVVRDWTAEESTERLASWTGATVS
jgi:peptidoglycan/xylan/chitin deacetylase (PgdA/CDA1 family)